MREPYGAIEIYGSLLRVVAGVCMAEQATLQALKKELQALYGSGYYEGSGDAAVKAVLDLIDKSLLVYEKIDKEKLTTVTGRLCSREPNLQNIPLRTEEGKAVRDAFLPIEGLVDADFASIEKRLLGDTEKL